MGHCMQGRSGLEGTITAIVSLTGAVLLVQVDPVLAEDDSIEGSAYRFSVHAFLGHGIKLLALGGTPHGPGG